MQKIKIVVCGDTGVGKTSLLMGHSRNLFPEEYVPAVYPDHFADASVDDKDVKLWLWDTNGKVGRESSPEYYEDANVLAIAFAVDSVTSFQHAKTKWHRQTSANFPGVPVILLGLKTDLRAEGQTEGVVTTAMGERLKDRLRAYKYVECSARTLQGVEEVLHEAVRAVWAKEAKRKLKCMVM